ncbi:hypothetical protein [Halorarius halobius]|uniref:hypothetical protein n=1 Tax=Halorarius halobius TaxID=2962671 RepID=UPI0020CBF789|nr:hypothetical protein [Halorarius halobius]
MPSEDTTDAAALGLTVVFVVGVLLYGFFVLQQLLLSGMIAVLGVVAYLAWRLLR